MQDLLAKLEGTRYQLVYMYVSYMCGTFLLICAGVCIFLKCNAYQTKLHVIIVIAYTLHKQRQLYNQLACLIYIFYKY